jgi:hypothetical protein
MNVERRRAAFDDTMLLSIAVIVVERCRRRCWRETLIRRLVTIPDTVDMWLEPRI